MKFTEAYLLGRNIVEINGDKNVINGIEQSHIETLSCYPLYDSTSFDEIEHIYGDSIDDFIGEQCKKQLNAYFIQEEIRNNLTQDMIRRFNNEVEK